VAVADVKIDHLIESIFDIFCHYRKLNSMWNRVYVCFTFVYESVLVITGVLWTSQVSGKQIVKNTQINGIDRPAGPGRAFHSPGRADILMHLNGPGRAYVLSGRAGPGRVFSARAELYYLT